MGLKPPNPPHPLATAGPSPGVLDAGHNTRTFQQFQVSKALTNSAKKGPVLQICSVRMGAFF